MIGNRSSMRRPMNRRGISGKWKAMWHSSPSPKYATRVLGPLVRFREQHAVVEARVDVPAQFLQELVRLRQVLAGRAFPLEQVRHRVEAQPVHAELEPVLDGAQHLPPHLGVVVVQVGLDA